MSGAAGGPTFAAPAIGIDIASIERVAGLLARRPGFGERAFTAAERHHCAGKPQRWASRWAAKEAVRKLAGGLGLPLPAFRDIEVGGASGNPPTVSVRGWDIPLTVSLSHDRDSAVAVAATLSEPEAGAWAAPRWRPSPELRLPKRSADAHKGTFGTVVVVAGAPGFAGAPVLAATGAARAGAGLVRACVPASIHGQVAAHCLEVMVHPLPASERGTLAVEAVEVLLTDHLSAASAVVVGPGLTTDSGTQQTVIRLLTQIRCPAVADADALNIVALNSFDWSLAPAQIVITPHPAEMSRLTGLGVADIQADRRGTASGYARDHGVTVVLKGSGTVVAAPDGRVNVSSARVVALATGGTGDVLGGVIAALLAQGLEGFDAAVAGVAIHAEAGAAVEARQGRAGGLARDLVELLPQAQERLRRALEAARR